MSRRREKGNTQLTWDHFSSLQLFQQLIKLLSLTGTMQNQAQRRKHVYNVNSNTWSSVLRWSSANTNRQQQGETHTHTCTHTHTHTHTQPSPGLLMHLCLFERGLDPVSVLMHLVHVDPPVLQSDTTVSMLGNYWRSSSRGGWSSLWQNNRMNNQRDEIIHRL